MLPWQYTTLMYMNEIVVLLTENVVYSILVRSTHTYLPMKMEQTECSEMLAYKFQMLGNYPEESKQLPVIWFPFFIF
jgi:hypothetical protein